MFALNRGPRAASADETRFGRTNAGRVGFGGNPYAFLGRRPFREARLRSYIVAQHRAGRPLSAILADPYARRCGSESFCWQVLQDPRTIEALERDVCETIERCARQC
jgi:hypothetical protein